MGQTTVLLDGPERMTYFINDHADKVFSLAIPDKAALEAKFCPELLGGVTVIRGTGQAAVRRADGSRAAEQAELTAIPYYAWCNRGAGQMQVWMPRTLDQAAP